MGAFPSLVSCGTDSTTTTIDTVPFNQPDGVDSNSQQQPPTKRARYKSLDSVPIGAVYLQCECRPGICEKVTVLWPNPGNGKEDQRVEKAITFMKKSSTHLYPADQLGRQRVILSVNRTSDNSGLSYSNGFNKHKTHLKACIRLSKDLKATQTVQQEDLPNFFRDFRCVPKTMGSLKERQKVKRDKKRKYYEQLENLGRNLVSFAAEDEIMRSCVCKMKMRGDIPEGLLEEISQQNQQDNQCQD